MYTLKNLMIALIFVVVSSASAQSKLESSNKKSVYIIRFAEPALSKSHAELFRTKRSAIKNNNLASSQQINQQIHDLIKQKRLSKQQYIDHINQTIQSPMAVIKHLDLALNGVIVQLNEQEAKAISKLPNVKAVEKDRILQLRTASTGQLIGASNIWQYNLSNGLGTHGEGIIIGIMDTGINTDHPSFAATAGDGYTHNNPKGNGVYVGDCLVDRNLCNSKLIGVRSYPEITDNYSNAIFTETRPATGEDYSGHGSHVASTAAGNLLLDVPITNPGSGTVSDGVASNVIYPSISGVAPRSNIISYQVCHPGLEDDSFSGCPTSVFLSAIDDAIADDVDVINYSIGEDTYLSPWDDSVALAFLAARDSGIFVAQSAGNTGPTEGSATDLSPWHMTVGATSHGRVFSKQLHNFTGGNSSLSAIQGTGITEAFTGDIVYAGNFSNPNSPTEPEQCLEPFPANTFTSTQIVMCDRGTIARIQKAMNVQAGGAGGFVLANIDGGDSFMANDEYVIPGIQINASDGNNLRDWLQSGSHHQATISSYSIVTDPDTSDIIASFSARGPMQQQLSLLSPDVTAPGQDVYAAYADEQPFFDVSTPAPSDYNSMSGTSMASPHVAGSAALIKALNPAWSAAEIQSALMLTATSDVYLDEQKTQLANMFTQGSGRVRVDLAIESGLLMHETDANYRAANPALANGDPELLNLPYIMSGLCVSSCTWQRTVKASKTTSWTVSSQMQDASYNLQVSPSSFSLTAGQSQVLTITATVNQLDASQAYYFGSITLTASDNSIPTARMPVAFVPQYGDMPESVNLDDSDNTGSQAIQVSSIASSSLVSRIYGPVAVDKNTENVTPLSNQSGFDDPYGSIPDSEKSVILFQIPQNTQALLTEILATTSQDADLFLGIDSNDNGLAEASEELCVSATEISLEKCILDLPAAGQYWLILTNYSGSGSLTDPIDFTIAAIPNSDSGDTQLALPAMVQTYVPYDITLSWDLTNATAEYHYGLFDLGPDSGNLGQLGQTHFRIALASPNIPVNLAPTAVVANANITANRNTTVSLNASNSSDPDVNDSLSFNWQQTSGTNVTLNDASNAIASFTAPNSAGTLVFEVTVSDGELSDTAQVTVTVTIPPPPPSNNSGGGGGGSLGIWLLLTLVFIAYRHRKTVIFDK